MERCDIFDNTIWNQLEEWTVGMWREAYQFPSGGAGMASWNDTFVDGKFFHMVDSKDGYLVRDCRNAR